MKGRLYAGYSTGHRIVACFGGFDPGVAAQQRLGLLSQRWLGRHFTDPSRLISDWADLVLEVKWLMQN
jgi:hypothetical protein